MIKFISIADDRTRLIVQAVCVVSFVTVSYFLTDAIAQQGVKKQALNAIVSNEHLLIEHERLLGEYRKLAEAIHQIDLQDNRLSWEDIAADWADVSLYEVIKRLEGLYQGDKSLVISEFTFENRELTNPVNLLNESDSKGKTTFGIKGFLLCNCP